jgi:hypothetical protein
MRRLMNDNRIREISSSVDIRGLNLLDSRTTVGSLSENDEYSYDEMERFWSNSRNIRESIATGSEPFPGEMLNPTSENVTLSKEMLDLMVDYYIATYEKFDFQAPFDDGPEDSIIISRVTINKFGRCRIGSEVFGSTMSSRHVKSSFILVNFITRDDNVDCYAGQVQYFFKHIVDFEDGPVEHNLAYVRWYKPAEISEVRYYFSIDDDEETCNVELWKNEFLPSYGRDSIIPVQNILCRFVPVKYKISNRQNAIEYLAINPINRKFHIR